MRIMVADLKGLVVLIYPVVLLAGMLQLNNVWAVAHAVSPAVPMVSWLQIFMGAMIYPLFLTAFFRLDGANILFQFSTVIFISALFGLVVFPLVAVPCGIALGASSGLSPWLNGAVLLIDMVAAIAFLASLTETDLHRIPKQLIWVSLIILEVVAMFFVMYQFEIPQKMYKSVMGQAAPVPVKK